ncbi:MAG: nitroreductase family protein [Syntrophales bacterium]
MDVQALAAVIKARRSIRKWQDRPVPEEVLRKAVELATWAPNGGNYQGWRFVAVTNRAVIVRMADAVQAVADRISAWPEGAAWPDEVEKARKHSSYFRNAPVCIGVFIRQYRSAADKLLLAREASDEEARRILAYRRSAPTAIQSAAAAVTTLLLALHAVGLGAVWLGAPLIAKEELETLMNAPAEASLVCLVAAGYPDESPRRDRRPVEEVLEFIR